MSARLQSILHRAQRAITLATSRVHFRDLTSVGRRPRTVKAPHIENRGRIDVGEDFFFSSHPVTSHLVCERGAHIAIGDRVAIGSGAAIASQIEIRIGDDVRIGRGVMILDTDFHDANAMGTSGEPLAVVIEQGAHIDDNVVVLKGARIGAGAHIGAGSVVSGLIEAGVFATGVPARTRRMGARATVDTNVVDRIRTVFAETFDIGRPVELTDSAREIPRWDSLGTLRLLLAIEDELGIRLGDGGLYGANTVGDVVAIALEASPRLVT